jgi:hypothetical protein
MVAMVTDWRFLPGDYSRRSVRARLGTANDKRKTGKTLFPAARNPMVSVVSRSAADIG